MPPAHERIAIGADHGGFALKEELLKAMRTLGIDSIDVGTFSKDAVDYPDIARKVAEVVLGEDVPGIAICGTGIGVSIAGNKVPGIRAARCCTPEDAEMARRHNNANVLCLGGRQLNVQQAMEMVKLFLTTPFDGDSDSGKDGQRHVERIRKIHILDGHSSC